MTKLRFRQYELSLLATIRQSTALLLALARMGCQPIIASCSESTPNVKCPFPAKPLLNLSISQNIRYAYYVFMIAGGKHHNLT